ncbi:MAG: peptidyl-prolyl cis-trans isomerase [Puniceicoccales bacterium]|jgi:parvulin-like peptidyl-prolyl isomerase|nr:peptidyl-prolyl cis-trans isomerase [Puniceicoccales bacterium]
MRGLRRVCGALFCGLCGTIFAACPPETATDLDAGAFWQEFYVNGVVAEVNGRVITAGELRQELQPLLAKMEATCSTQEEFDGRMREMTRRVLNEMIDRVLIVQAFEKDGNRVPEMHKNFQLDEFIRTRFGGDRALFVEKLRECGKSLQQFKREMEEAFIVDWMTERIRQSRAEISPTQARSYYEQNKSAFCRQPTVRLRQIRVPADTDGTCVAEILRNLRAGEDSAKLRDKYSAHTRKNENTWLSDKEMEESLALAIAEADVGEFVGPVHLSDCIAIVEVLDRREGFQLSFEEVQDEVEGRLLRDSMREAREDWLRELRQCAHIKIYL